MNLVLLHNERTRRKESNEKEKLETSRAGRKGKRMRKWNVVLFAAILGSRSRPPGAGDALNVLETEVTLLEGSLLAPTSKTSALIPLSRIRGCSVFGQSL